MREELEKRGAGFVTTSDTEVLLAALDRDGMDALDRCEGMWSFALFDEADDSLTLCRDRFGEKPLYILPGAGRSLLRLRGEVPVRVDGAFVAGQSASI